MNERETLPPLEVLRAAFESEIHTPNAILHRIHQMGYDIVAVSPSQTCAVCGATGDDHVGNCHFGWHNPETCPRLAEDWEPRHALCGASFMAGAQCILPEGHSGTHHDGT